MYLIPLATSLEEVPSNVFWDAILLYHNSPHLVNRRLIGSLLILVLKVDFNNATIKLTEILTRTSILYEVRKLQELSKEYITEHLIKSVLEPYDKNVTLTAVSVEDLKELQGEVFVTVKILLPRQQHFKRCMEVAILDKINNIATFLAIIEVDQTAVAPRFPYMLECSNTGYRLCVELENAESSASTWLLDHLFAKFENWVENSNGDLKANPSLALISIDIYTSLYNNLKDKYGKELVKAWTEKTDPLKYVYEDLAIAAYLITLWEKLTPNYKPNFVDLGCGNGLLVHILNSEGFPGYGIDVRKRKIWDWYPESTVLQVKTITPSESCLFPEADWIIGNHSDELTPWIPVIAARSSMKTNFFLLPCCCYEFSGQKFVRKNTSISSYSEYLIYVRDIASQCGFTVMLDRLRIPSTRRTCLISMNRNYKPEQFNEINVQISKLILENSQNSLMWTDNFKARSDTEVVRNCTQLDKNLIANIIKKIVLLLLDDEQGQIKSNGKIWNQGKIISLTQLAKLLSDDLQLLKSENGGIQTLLKNHRYIFEVTNGAVRLRLPSTVELTNNKYKNKPCWFNTNHPEGCFNESDVCAYKH